METIRITILGGGYGGIAAAKTLLKKLSPVSRLQITLIEKNSYHTLLTELHEAAAGRVPPKAIKLSYEKIFKNHWTSFKIVKDEILHIDFNQKILQSENHRYSFDYLILATGSKPEFFGNKSIEVEGFKLWSYKEAVVLRDHITGCFKLAASRNSEAEQKSLLTFIVAGGGFTGVEMAGELASYAKTLCKKYSISFEKVSVYLVEAMPSILNNLDAKSINKSLKYLSRLGIRVLANTRIQEAAKGKVHLSNGLTLDGTLIWTAGIKGNPYLQKSDIDLDNRSRIKVNPYLQTLQYPYVFSCGDAVSYLYKDRPLPQIVENAMQSGTLAALNTLNSIEKKTLRPYEPHFHGSMISIGPRYAVANVGRLIIGGLPATLLKHFVHAHYHFHIGGPLIAAEYAEKQFIAKYLDPILSRGNGIMEKQVTQFISNEEASS